MVNEEYEAMKKKALEQLMSGKSLLGKDGAFAPILQQFLESALEAEMEEHLDERERSKKNKRNGKGEKTVKSNVGEVTIETPQDRNSTFEPQLIKKRERVLADTLAPKILSLYGMGMSFRDISKHIEEMYDTQVSATLLSQITDRVIPEIQEWRNRPLDEVYPIVWLDAIHFKVKEEGTVRSKAIYSILAITKQGNKDLLGIYLSENEGANFWLQVLTDLNNRGIKDILIACTDNLRGFSEAVRSIFPKSEVQLCIIHQIRNSLKYVASKNRKEFMRDLKLVYRADTKETAESELDNLEEKWGNKYPIVIKSWRLNWDDLSTYFAYTPEIRKMIYTTNAVEGYHRQIRKVTKNKGLFTSDMALIKLIYLALQHIMEKWKTPISDWGIKSQQLAIRFGDRFIIDLSY